MSATEPPAAYLEHPAQLFRLLADENRLRLLLALAEHDEMSVTGLRETAGLTPPALKHHLQLLRMSGVITIGRQGHNIFYSLMSGLVRSLLRYVVP
jgi:ArsR family transcriptional regulator